MTNTDNYEKGQIIYISFIKMTVQDKMHNPEILCKALLPTPQTPHKHRVKVNVETPVDLLDKKITK